MTTSEQPKKLVRFDFQPGASAKEIAEALEAAREKAVREHGEARAKAKQKELQDWRATLTKEEDAVIDQMIQQQGEEYVLSILGQLKKQLEYFRSL